MSTGLSIFVTVITLFTIFGSAFLLWWCWTDKMGVEEGESMGHSFDGIEELNNPLPTWWSYMFVLLIVFGLGYLLLYPGLGNFQGLFQWKSAHKDVQSLEDVAKAREQESGVVQYEREMARGEEIANEVFGKFRDRSVEELATVDEAIQIGRRLFLQNCSQCHGADARGGLGFPNLTDDDWLYGGEAATIRHTIMEGRNAAMPAWDAVLGEDGVRNMAAYVLSLSGRKVDATEAAAGQAQFALCAACHGADGKGMHAMGAPNLTDNIWLYGGSRRAVEETLRHGRNGVMPAWKDILGEDKIHVLTAYVYQLSRQTEGQ